MYNYERTTLRGYPDVANQLAMIKNLQESYKRLTRQVELLTRAVEVSNTLSMRPVEATYEDGLLKPAQPLQLRPGERVGVILVRRPDPHRWDLQRIAATVGPEDDELAKLGMDDWAAELDREESK